jgi:class 3 adenylate cyclase
MGVHMGTPRMVRDPMTRRVEYIGPVVNAAARITAMTHGGQIVLSHTVYDKVKDMGQAGGEQQQEEVEHGQVAQRMLVGLGKFEIPDSPSGTAA